jgi:hypothetical protein
LKFVQIKGKVFFKGEIITKMYKWVGSFKNLLQNHQANFNQTWHKSYLGEGDSKIVQKKGIAFFPRGDDTKRVKIH